ncbi:MAG: glycosyltransferase family 2 protein [Deinococcales bacterium]
MPNQRFNLWCQQATNVCDLSIIIPAYNEAKRILPTIAAISVVVSEMTLNWELIISDDGSKDETVALLEPLNWVNLKVIQHANTGKGGAVKRGIMAAKGSYLLFADADNSTPIEELKKLLQELMTGYDIAIGSRAAAGAKEENKSPVRHFISYGVRQLAQLISGLRVEDSQCGFKLFRREVALELFELQKMPGFSFDLEILYLANKFNHPVAEVPVHWYDAPGSKVNSVKDSWRFFKDILSIRHLDKAGGYANAKAVPVLRAKLEPQFQA